MDVLSDQDFYQKLLESSFRYVSFRPRSEKEIRDFLLKKLQRRKVSDGRIVERVLTRLRDLGYLDDAKFVSWWIEQRESHRPKGARIIKQELLAKGISRDIIDEQVKRCQSSSGREQNSIISEDELAQKAIAKKLPLWRKLPMLEQKKKIYGFLGRRGFDTETIRHVIDEVVMGKVQYS